MYNPAIFKDRTEAGKKLAEKVKKLKLENPIVLAIPCGGVPVGVEIAKKLGCPLNLIVLRKLQIPDNPEAGFGAITADKTVISEGKNEQSEFILNPGIAPFLGLTQNQIDSIVEKTVAEIKRREKVFKVRKITLINKSVILVDDGLASGYTMLAAIKSVKKQKPKKVLVAVSTASGRAVSLVKAEVDRFICLYIHPGQLPFAVASSYKNWHDLKDEEVLEILKNFRSTN